MQFNPTIKIFQFGKVKYQKNSRFKVPISENQNLRGWHEQTVAKAGDPVVVETRDR